MIFFFNGYFSSSRTNASLVWNKQDARESFRYGLAAASASCLIIDQSSVYDGETMLKIAQDIAFTTRPVLVLSSLN